MKKIYILLLISLITGNIYSQDIKTEFSEYNWKTFDTSYQDNLENLIRDKNIELGLGDDDNLMLYKQDIDDLRIEHYRYHQIHKGVKVEGADYLIHRSNDKMWGNGRLVYGIEADPNPGISEEDALQNALEYIGASTFYWEDASQEAFIKWFKDDPEATFYPEGELVFSEEKFGQDGKEYQLFWKFDIYAHGEKMREYVYVNANDGSIGHSRDAICYSSAEGSANTYYYGEQTIITDSIAPDSFRLVDETRGGGVYTMNLDYNPPSYEAYFEPGSHFNDDDNNWDSDIANAETDAHWSTEKTYDFYMENYDRNSFDDNGAKMVMGVHFGVNTNCFGVGFFSGMYVAIGDGGSCGHPGYHLEHVGHEFTHGVTAYSAGLIGGYETGSINESYSNIMGMAIKFYAIPDVATWQFKSTGNGQLEYFFSDPNNSTGIFGGHFPDTYLGNYWVDSTASQGEIGHVNCSIQDYCYYLLCEGGSGSNDNGDLYNVEAIGMDKATDIVYRSLSYFTFPTSQFVDTRQAFILSAIDLYGECSNEVDQVIEAWYAVGVGSNSSSTNPSKDIFLTELISPSNHCGLSEEEVVEVKMLHNLSGCNSMIASGSEIEMNYKLDNNDTVTETFVLSQDLLEGESINYSFIETINIPDIGEVYTLSVWINYSGDEIQFNDSILYNKIGLKYSLYEEDIMTFEDLTNSPDSFYVNKGAYANAFISPEAANTGNYGYSLSASGTNLIFPADPSLNFDFQKDLISEICFCVDAQEWETVTLYFDMKQTHSALYMHFWGNDSTEFSSSMRMMVNGEPFGEQFHPETYVEDPYLTYSYSLDQFNLAGTNFELCFQSKNHTDDTDVPSPFFPFNTDGDNTYLDNIRFVNEALVSVEEIQLENISIYPNPASDVLFIESEVILDDYDIRMFNQLGQNVLQLQNITGPIEISSLEPGVYIIEINNANGSKREKVVIQ